jgi:hypothetical protein
MPFTAKVYDTPPPPSAPRSPTHIRASVSLPDSRAHHVIVHNLSAQALLVESYHPLEIGAEVSFEIDELGTVAAQVTWRDGQFYDCALLTPLTPTQVRTKLTSAKVVWGNFPDHSRPEGQSARHISFTPVEAPRPAASDGRLSPRSRLAIIVVAATLCWAIPVALLLLLFR